MSSTQNQSNDKDKRALNNNNKVSVSVLDRFIKLSQENAQAYLSVVTTMENISAALTELTDRIEGLEKEIESGQPPEALRRTLQEILGYVDAIQLALGKRMPPEYDLEKGLAKAMEYNDLKAPAVAENIIWFTSILNFIRRRRFLITFLAGILLVLVAGASGVSLWDLIKPIFVLK